MLKQSHSSAHTHTLQSSSLKLPMMCCCRTNRDDDQTLTPEGQPGREFVREGRPYGARRHQRHLAAIEINNSILCVRRGIFGRRRDSAPISNGPIRERDESAPPMVKDRGKWKSEIFHPRSNCGQPALSLAPPPVSVISRRVSGVDSVLARLVLKPLYELSANPIDFVPSVLLIPDQSICEKSFTSRPASAATRSEPR